MAGENILINLKHKLEVKTRPHLLQQLLLHHSSLLEKLTLCKRLQGLIFDSLVILHVFLTLMMVSGISNKFIRSSIWK